MKLSNIQKEIVDTPGNMIVSASAGTGKTHTMVAKIEKEISENHSHKVIAAITFTVKAAKEIRDRLSIDSVDHFIGTNNSFVIGEIIKPFAKDVFGDEYDSDMSTDYSVKEKTFSDCMTHLRNERIITAYSDNKKNFVFDLALNIVKNSIACQLFLKAKYFKIYVDEYQDCDKTMHEFFLYLCQDLGIELFVVGDDKQSIYIWRGAYPEAFKGLLNAQDFSKKVLSANFRSCQMIQNYSNLLSEDTSYLYKQDSETDAIVLLKTTSSNWMNDILPYINLEKETAFLRFKNEDAKNGAEILSKSGVEFTYVPKTPISEITTDVSWLYNAIAQYFIVNKYSVYDFIDEIPDESVGDRKILKYIERQLVVIEAALANQNISRILETTKEIAAYFGYTGSETHIEAMIETIVKEVYHPAFHLDELTHVSITFHSSKGLEYEQVIVFANDYPLNKADSIYNHYVAVTRAKTKLIIVRVIDTADWKETSYCRCIYSLFQKRNVKMSDVMTIC